jgi:hypothetical protein
VPRERARPGPWRALVFAGIGAIIVGLAFLVARIRPGPPPPSEVGGRASGLSVVYLRAGEIRRASPDSMLAPGDVLRFSVRAPEARYLEVRLRAAGAAADSTIFPAGPQAQLVRPGQTLPVEPVLGAASGKTMVTAIFADHPFAAGGPPPSDSEVVTVSLETAPP